MCSLQEHVQYIHITIRIWFLYHFPGKVHKISFNLRRRKIKSRIKPASCRQSSMYLRVNLTRIFRNFKSKSQKRGAFFFITLVKKNQATFKLCLLRANQQNDSCITIVFLEKRYFKIMTINYTIIINRNQTVNY